MRRRRPSARSLTCLDTGRQGFGSRWCANRCGQLHAGGQIGTGFSQEKTLARMYRGLEIGEKFDSTGRNHENRECPSQEWACGAAGSALPWHGRGHRFDPGQVHQYILQKKQCNAKVSVKAGFFYVHRSELGSAEARGVKQLGSVECRLDCEGGGETGIRTLDTLRYTRFPSVRLKPLGHLSVVGEPL